MNTKQEEMEYVRREYPYTGNYAHQDYAHQDYATRECIQEKFELERRRLNFTTDRRTGERCQRHFTVPDLIVYDYLRCKFHFFGMRRLIVLKLASYISKYLNEYHVQCGMTMMSRDMEDDYIFNQIETILYKVSSCIYHTGEDSLSVQYLLKKLRTVCHWTEFDTDFFVIYGTLFEDFPPDEPNDEDDEYVPDEYVPYEYVHPNFQFEEENYDDMYNDLPPLEPLDTPVTPNKPLYLNRNFNIKPENTYHKYPQAPVKPSNNFKYGVKEELKKCEDYDNTYDNRYYEELKKCEDYEQHNELGDRDFEHTYFEHADFEYNPSTVLNFSDLEDYEHSEIDENTESNSQNSTENHLYQILNSKYEEYKNSEDHFIDFLEETSGETGEELWIDFVSELKKNKNN
jgi:hypothetical protein